MEYVPGQTLAALVAADGWLPAPARGRRHRSRRRRPGLRPRAGHRPPRRQAFQPPAASSAAQARLSDFGVAHIDGEAPLTVMGDVLGTIEYASPEQVHGNETPDARSDVYSLAAVAYFALTGTPPFRAADNSTQAQLSVMHRQVFAEPPPLRFHREDISERKGRPARPGESARRSLPVRRPVRRRPARRGRGRGRRTGAAGNDCFFASHWRVCGSVGWGNSSFACGFRHLEGRFCCFLCPCFPAS